MYIKQGDKIILEGTALWDSDLVQTRSGKYVSHFKMKYDRHHNEDGQMVNESIEVSVWRDNALFVGDPNIGVSKGDTVLVFGRLVEDNYYKEGEDKSVTKYKVEANLVYDMTSFYQLARMVVGGEDAEEEETESEPPKPEAKPAPQQSAFVDEDEDDGELPF